MESLPCCEERGCEVSDTPRTDFEESMQTQRFGVYMVKADFARTLERENAAMREAIRVSLIRAYTAGYLHGHEATVEGGFIPVHRSDETEFHAESTHQMLCDGSLPELQPYLKP